MTLGTERNHLKTAHPTHLNPQDLLTEIESMLQRHHYTNRGPKVLEFEAALNHYFGIPDLQFVTVSNATVGLEIALKALKLPGETRAVALPSFTFAATALSVINAGFEPVFLDIDPVSLCLSPEAVRAHLRHSPLAAIVPVHVFGRICDLPEFQDLNDSGIPVIYDSAHSIGVRHCSKQVGGWGTAEVFSFHATKLLNACEGGAVATRNPSFADQIRSMSQFCFNSESEVTDLGTNAKMSEVHAIFGLASLKNLEAEISKRISLANHYRLALKNTDRIFIPPPQPEVQENAHYFPVLFKSEAERNDCFEALRQSSIFARKYFYPALHTMPAFRKFKTGPLSVTDRVASTVLCLPINGQMSADDVQMICEKIIA